MWGLERGCLQVVLKVNFYKSTKGKKNHKIKGGSCKHVIKLCKSCLLKFFFSVKL
jgi:hypothetical protein